MPALRDVGFARLAAVLIIAIVGGYVAFVFAVAGVTRNKNPVMALEFMPGEGQALAKQADLLFATNPENPPKMVRQLAIRSLRSQALNPRALRLLGYVSQDGGRTRDPLTLISLAARLTRREPGAQLWLVQRAARQGDLSQAISHIDILLRTKPSTESALFPIMIQGLSDPRFRTLFRQYMGKPSPWVADFLNYSIANTNDLPSLVKMIEEAKGFPPSDASTGQFQGLMSQLDRAAQYAALRRIYLLMPNAEASRLRDAAFTMSDIDGHFGIAGWRLFDKPDAGAAFQMAKGSSHPQLTLYANASTTSVVASKLLYLEPGNYTLSTTVENIESGPQGGLSWSLRCPTRDAHPMLWTGQWVSSRSTTALGVPADCPVQFLELIASGGDGQNGFDATISSVKMTATRSANARQRMESPGAKD